MLPAAGCGFDTISSLLDILCIIIEALCEGGIWLYIGSSVSCDQLRCTMYAIVALIIHMTCLKRKICQYQAVLH